jgi:HEAT repeat protein
MPRDGDEVRDEARRPALAIGALAFGSLGLLLSPVLFGFAVGALGLGFGLAHLFLGRRPRTLAVLGSGVSALAMIASLAAGVWYVRLLSRRPASLPPARQERSTEAWADWRGRRAPPIRVTTLRGETLDLASLEGRLVVLDFWATWCGPCVKVIPNLNRISSEWGKDVVVVGITAEGRGVVERFMASHPVEYRVVAGLDDETLPEPFSRVSSIPTLFFIGRDGMVRSVLVSYHEHDALEAQLLVAEAAERRAKGSSEEALRLAAKALEAQLGEETEGPLAAAFEGDPGYADVHDRVRSLVEGLLGHYERKYDRRFGRDRASVLWAIWSLGTERKDAEAVPQLVRYLHESVLDEARWRAAQALWAIGDRRAAPQLVAALEDPSPRVAGFAASGLGDLGDASAVGPLLALFQRLPDNRDEAKARVAEALGKLGDPRAVGPLSASLETIRDPAYVRWAEPALRRLETLR